MAAGNQRLKRGTGPSRLSPRSATRRSPAATGSRRIPGVPIKFLKMDMFLSFLPDDNDIKLEELVEPAHHRGVDLCRGGASRPHRRREPKSVSTLRDSPFVPTGAISLPGLHRGATGISTDLLGFTTVWRVGRLHAAAVDQHS